MESLAKPMTFAALFLALAVSVSAPAAVAGGDGVRFAEAAGKAVAYRMLGSGRPTIVLLSGLGDGMASFSDIAPELAKQATVIAYDRAGYGDSAKPDGPRDAVAAEIELLAVLRASGRPGPYILVGHSLGGLYAEYFAARRPELVRALVLEESRPSGFGRACEAAGIAACAPSLALARLMPAGPRAEIEGLAAAQAQVEAASPVHGKPVLVLSRPIPEAAPPFDRLWSQSQNDLAARYPSARHLTAPGGGHYIHRDQSEWFLKVLRDQLRQQLRP